MKTIRCSQCGQFTAQAKEHAIQELDPVVPALKPPDILTEYECSKCGWLAVAPGTAA